MRRFTRTLIGTVGAICALAIAAVMLLSFVAMREPAPKPEVLPETCEDKVFEDETFIVCVVDPSRYAIGLRLRDTSGQAFGSLDKLPPDPALVLAMNAGMYHEDLSPVGLYVENGVEMTPLNLADAAGNFFMKPNGVFFVDGSGKMGVMESGAFAAAGLKPQFASQSGPMLVIDGAMHPRFEVDGASRYIRNGVGVDAEGRAVLVLSRSEVSLGKLARFFRDSLNCRNALFFDGAISVLYDGCRTIVGGAHPVGPIMTVRRRDEPLTQ